MCHSVFMNYKTFKIDEEWEHQGVLYWLTAQADINVIHSRTGDLETSWAVSELGDEVTINDVEALAYTSDYAGYETPVIEPRILEAARQYIITNAQEYV